MKSTVRRANITRSKPVKHLSDGKKSAKSQSFCHAEKPETKITAATLPSDAISLSTVLQKQGCCYLRNIYRPLTVSRWTMNIDKMKPGKHDGSGVDSRNRRMKKALIHSRLTERGCGIHLITFPAASALCLTGGVACLSLEDSSR